MKENTEIEKPIVLSHKNIRTIYIYSNLHNECAASGSQVVLKGGTRNGEIGNRKRRNTETTKYTLVIYFYYYCLYKPDKFEFLATSFLTQRD